MSVIRESLIVAARDLMPKKPDEFIVAFADAVYRGIYDDGMFYAARIDERRRIADIISHAADDGDIQAGLRLALTTELSAEDAIQILSGKQSAGVIRPN